MQTVYNSVILYYNANIQIIVRVYGFKNNDGCIPYIA